MEHPYLLGIIIYLGVGLFVTTVALADTLDTAHDPAIRWYHIVRILLLCMFISQLILIWVVITEGFAGCRNKIKTKFRWGNNA